jgi:hypothetical protein
MYRYVENNGQPVTRDGRFVEEKISFKPEELEVRWLEEE